MQIKQTLKLWRSSLKRYEEKGRRYTTTNEGNSNLSKLPTWIPSFPQCSSSSSSSKMCPRDVPIRVFPDCSPNAQLSLFICWKIGQNAQQRVVLASRSPAGVPLARYQRLHAAGLPVALWLARGSPVGEPLASSFHKIDNWLFLAPFSSFVVALGFHRASNTCPPLPTQARKRVEEFLCLTYTIIKLQISHKWMISYLHHFLLVFVCFVVYVSSKRVWTRRK